MRALRTHSAGVDVYKELILVTTLIGAADEDPKEEIFECSTMTGDLIGMGRILLDKGIREVGMESTGVSGIDKALAMSILAEATTKMDAFADKRKFAAWAGVAPGNNESASKKKIKMSKRKPHLRKLLVLAANAVKQKHKSYYRSKFTKLQFRLGSANKAKVAIANRLARAIYKVLGGNEFKDIGYKRGDPHEDRIRKLIAELKSLGVIVRHQHHQVIIDSVKKVKVDKTGLHIQH